MNSLRYILSFLIFISYYYAISIISLDEFNKISEQKNCDKHIVYKDCPEYIDQINHFKDDINYLRKEKIYFSETPKKGYEISNVFTIIKNGNKFYFPPKVLDVKNKVINEYSISKGDTILAYHLFNKVFLVELLNEIIKYDLVCQKPQRNSEGYDFDLMASDFDIIKREFKFSGNTKIKEDYSFDNFIKQLKDIKNDKTDAFPCHKIITINDNKGIRLQKLNIKKGIITDKKLDTIYDEKRAVWHHTIGQDLSDFNKNQWQIFLNKKYKNEYTVKQILEILTYWINIHTNALFENFSRSITIKDNKIIHPKQLWVIELFKNRS